jgi:hypothetical protein
MAIKLQHFVVEGGGAFPMDMLRYDGCHPYTSDDVAAICVQPGDEGYGIRKVKLSRYVFKKADQPTFGRWLSYKWKVVQVDSAQIR